MLFDMEKHIYSESYSIRYNRVRRQMLKKIPSDKINTARNALFSLSGAPNHHSFTFNFQLLYEFSALYL